MDDDVTWALYDLLMALILAYFIVIAFPTFINNGVIILKESTMNQYAWSLEEDYEEGVYFGYSADILDYLGVNEDPEYYKEYI